MSPLLRVEILRIFGRSFDRCRGRPCGLQFREFSFGIGMPAELVIRHGQAPLNRPVVGLALTRGAGALEVALRVVGKPKERGALS